MSAVQLLQQSEVCSFGESTLFVHQCQQAQFLRETGRMGKKSIMLLHLFYQISTTFQNISLISLDHFPDSNRGMHPTQLLTDRESAFILTHFNSALIQKRLNLALQHLCVKVGQRFNSSGHMPRGHS